MVQLAIGDLFFACQSCKYLKVPQAENRRNIVPRLHCIQFIKNGGEVRHNHPALKYSDCVLITFEMQKNNEKFDTVTQVALVDALICPV